MATITGHVGINVTSLERSREFYSDVFGLRLVRGSEDAPHRFAFLGDGSRLVLTLWEQSKGRFDRRSPGLHHLSFQVEDVDAVRAVEARLRARGATFAYEGVVAHAEGAASGGIFFEDPDGTRLEIYAADAGAHATAPVNGAPTCGFF
jgi:catechol 2,3-dioxygenase-like lactoylglutathione lyase family enzyme